MSTDGCKRSRQQVRLKCAYVTTRAGARAFGVSSAFERARLAGVTRPVAHVICSELRRPIARLLRRAVLDLNVAAIDVAAFGEPFSKRLEEIARG
jgi:hypothetical protein